MGSEIGIICISEVRKWRFVIGDQILNKLTHKYMTAKANADQLQGYILVNTLPVEK